MTTIHHRLEVGDAGQPLAQIQGGFDPNQGPSLPAGVDPLLLAFLCLLEASNTSDTTALVHAKQLNQNAREQQKLNADLAALRRDELPKLDTKYHTNWHWHYYFFFWYNTGTKGSKYYTGQTAVDQAQAFNQELDAERQMLTDKMSVLQQNAQVGQERLETISNTAVGTAQEGSGVLQELLDLTFKALMRQQPQG